MASDATRARIAALRLRVDIAKAGPWDEEKHPRFPKGDPQGGQFAPGSLGEWLSGFFGGKKPDAIGTPSDVADPNWAASKGPQVPWHNVERKGSLLHPFPDDKGKPAFIHRPSEGSSPSSEAWTDPDRVLSVVPGQATPAALNGVPLKAAGPAENWQTVAGQNPQIEHGLPDLETIKGMHAGAGVIIEEPDGRVWLTKPLNGFGGYKHTFPKGTQEPGLTLQQTAIKEAWEETGLKVELTGVLGDFKRTTSVARYYLAKRVGGSPSAQGWESQAMRLVPHDKVISFLNMPVDRDIWRAYKAEDDIGKAREPFLDRSALHALQQRIDKLSGRTAAPSDPFAAIRKAYDESKHPRWPKGSPLGGQFMSLDAGGLPTPPKIGSASNPAAQNKANLAYAAAKAGDTAKVKELLDSTENSAPLKATYTKGAHPSVAYSKAGNGNGTYQQQAHQYIQALYDKQNSATLATLSTNNPDQGGSAPADLAQYKKIGGTLGGSSAAGQYTAPDGTKYYVKGTSGQGVQTADRAKNEVLASKLMLAAGAGAPEMHLVTGLPADLGGPKATGVASKMVDGVKLTAGSSPQALAAARADFAVHAWLGNRDVVGLSFDNTIIDANGKAVNIDPGGALLHRAQGLPMYPDLPYGNMPHNVQEWDTLRNGTNKTASAIYGGMTKSDLVNSAQKLAGLDDNTISDLVAKYGPGTPGQKLALAADLIARRDDVLKKAGITVMAAPKLDSLKAPASTVVAESGGVKDYLDGKEGHAGGVTIMYGEKVPAVSHTDLQDTLDRIAHHAEAGDADMVSSLGSGVYGLAGPAHEKDAVNTFAQNVAGKMTSDKAAGEPGPWNDWGAGKPAATAGYTYTHPGTGYAAGFSSDAWKPAAENVAHYHKLGDPQMLGNMADTYNAAAAKGGVAAADYTALGGLASHLQNHLHGDAGVEPLPPAGTPVKAAQAYAGSGYEAANEARHQAAMSKLTPEQLGPKPKVSFMGVPGAKGKSWQIEGAVWKAHSALAAGDLGKLQEASDKLAAFAQEFPVGSKGREKVRSLMLWAKDKAKLAGLDVKGSVYNAAGYKFSLPDGVANAAATAEVEAKAQAKQILSDATGFTIHTLQPGQPLHDHVLNAVKAFHAGDDMGMAKSMGAIAMSGYTASEPVYDKLAALAGTKADKFPLATGGQTTSTTDHFQADREKPAAVHVTHDSGATAPAQAKTVVDYLEKSPVMPPFQGPKKPYYDNLATKMQDAYATGDPEALKAVTEKFGQQGQLKWPAETINGKMMTAWHSQLQAGLGSAQAAHAAAALAEPVGVIPVPGASVSNKPAMPDFNKAKLTGDNTNADSHNKKVDAISALASKGDVKGLLALAYATNTYGKKQAKLANDALSALGSPFQVDPGQKKGMHPALSMTGLTTEQLTGQSAIKSAKLSPTELPPDVNFMTGNGGKGISSVAAVNKANQQAFDNLKAMALAGDYEGVKNATFQLVDKTTGAPSGAPIKINSGHQFASQHLVNYQQTVVDGMYEKLNPPSPLEIFQAKQAASSVAALAAQFPPVKLGANSKSMPSSQTMQHYIAIGQADPAGAKALVPKKTIQHSDGDAWTQQAYQDYKTWQNDSKAESFRAAVQGHGGHEYHKGWDKPSDVAYETSWGSKKLTGQDLMDRALAAHKWARELESGTKIYKWEDLSAGTMQKLATAQPGLIIQNPAPACASYHPTSTKGFGPSHRWTFIAAPGAKALNSFGSGSHSNEREVTMLPNYRMMIVGHTKAGGGKSYAETTVLLLPPDPKLNSDGYKHK